MKNNKDFPKVGTKKNPVQIQQVQIYYVVCPHCEETFDCSSEALILQCPNCNRVFNTEFDINRQ